MKFAYTLISLFVVTLTYGSPIDSLRSEQREEGLFVVHEVEQEETLYSISKRYGGSVLNIIKHNQIVDNRIEIGQIIYVLVEDVKPTQASVIEDPTADLLDIHRVESGETLYSISRKYGVKLKDLRKWNKLSNNDLSLGMLIKLSKKAKLEIDTLVAETITKVEIAELDTAKVDSLQGFEKYLVQTGETLSTIGRKIGSSIDSLKFWNDLQSDYLKIGQQLYYKPSEEVETIDINKPKKNSRVQIDENGFERIYEEGVASVIPSMETSRFLALHRSLPIGTTLEVRNLMNNQIVHVKVVGILPNTGLNKNLLLRLSQPAYDQLGILDSKSRVEVSYNKK